MKICVSCGYMSNNDRAKFCSKCASQMRTSWLTSKKYWILFVAVTIIPSVVYLVARRMTADSYYTVSNIYIFFCEGFLHAALFTFLYNMTSTKMTILFFAAYTPIRMIIISPHILREPVLEILLILGSGFIIYAILAGISRLLAKTKLPKEITFFLICSAIPLFQVILFGSGGWIMVTIITSATTGLTTYQLMKKRGLLIYA